MRILPSLEEVLAYRGGETHMALTVELLADTETPISLYQKLAADRPWSFLLESAEGGERFGRYSFIGCEAAAVFRFADGEGTIQRGEHAEPVRFQDPLRVIEGLLRAYQVVPREGLPRFQGGAVGYLGFDGVRYFEPVPLPEKKTLEIPEGVFLLVDELVIVDHLKHRVILVAHVPLAGDRAAHYAAGKARIEGLIARLEPPLPATRPFVPGGGVPLPPWRPNLDREGFEAAVRAAKEAICAGEIFQVVLSQRLTFDVDLPPFELYRVLRALNPSPYLFYLRFDGWAVVGASPEVLVRLERDEILLRPIAGTRRRGASRAEDEALARPIAGTRRRGASRAEDEALARELLEDEKELAEHRMLVDLGRNDLGRIARIGTVRVEDPLHIELYSHVMHIVSAVRCRLAPGRTAFDVLRACFPAGTVSGAPKIRAMELISRLEPDRRALYAGSVGYFDFTGNMDTCIAIRTMVVEPGRVHVQAGAGIVYDSEPAKEYEECLNKARGPMMAISLALERVGAQMTGAPGRADAQAATKAPGRVDAQAAAGALPQVDGDAHVREADSPSR